MQIFENKPSENTKNFETDYLQFVMFANQK